MIKVNCLSCQIRCFGFFSQLEAALRRLDTLNNPGNRFRRGEKYPLGLNKALYLQNDLSIQIGKLQIFSYIRV